MSDSYGFPDPQAALLKPLGFCTYEKCQEAITPEQCYLVHDGDYFCDRGCFCKHMGVVEVG